jgi:ABC-type multidrug transport system permease subunit
MAWRRIRAITRKDMKDALRDSRVLVALLTPILIGLLYSLIIPDGNPKPSGKVGYTAAGATQLPQAIQKVASGVGKVTFKIYPTTDDLRVAVRDKKVDIGIVVPAGFDAAVKAGHSPTLLVLLPQSPTFAGDYMAAALDRSVQTLSGSGPPAVITSESVAPKSLTSQGVIERLGVRKYLILGMVVFLLAMIATIALPIVLTEEVEKKTLDALLIIASPSEVAAAKALYGVVYGVLTVPLLMAITRVMPRDWPLFMADIALSSVTLVGLGLVLGAMLSNPNQTNTWGTLMLTPLVIPAFIGAATLPGWATALLQILPTTHTVRIASNALTDQPLYPNLWLSWLVLAAWGVAAYAVVVWRLRTREA